MKCVLREGECLARTPEACQCAKMSVLVYGEAYRRTYGEYQRLNLREETMTNQTSLTNYVAGFMFYDKFVLLVRKTRPPWQSGLVNAIGGKVEPGEDPWTAMDREFGEETNIAKDQHDGWRLFCTETDANHYVVNFFACRAKVRCFVPVANDANEMLGWVDHQALLSGQVKLRPVGNLHWLVPLALDPRAPMVNAVASTRAIADQPTWDCYGR